MSQIRTTYHHAIINKKRTGKTTLAMDILFDLLEHEKWEHIYSNTPVYAKHVPELHSWNAPHTVDCPLHPLLVRIKYLRELEEARNSPVLIDEISKALPSRKIGGMHSKEIYELIQELMSNLGRWGCPLIYTDQWRKGADVMVRTNVDFLYQPIIMMSDYNHHDGNVTMPYLVHKPKTTEFWELEQPTETGVMQHTQKMLRELFPLFKSEEPIALTYNPPFEILVWIAGFKEWLDKEKRTLKDYKISDVRNIIHTYMVETRYYINNKELSAVLGKLKMDGYI